MNSMDTPKKLIQLSKEDLLSAINGLKDVSYTVSPNFNDNAPGPGDNIIKRFMFPQPEPLLFLEREGKDMVHRPYCAISKSSLNPDDDTSHHTISDTVVETIILGIRPCDARSLWLNRLACEEDNLFSRRVDGLIIFGLLCNKGLSTCFCEDVGGGHQDVRGMDVAMIDDGDGELRLWAVSKKGLYILNRLGIYEDDIIDGLMEGATDNSHEKVGDCSLLDELMSKDMLTLYNAPFWQDIKDSCLNCGACTFLCPTCYCFDIQDEAYGKVGRRIRYWDSCMFPLFTLHASGHNPRGEKIYRVRNRFMHKFKYFIERFSHISCVGCGRCIIHCPVNIDVREVIGLMRAVS